MDKDVEIRRIVRQEMVSFMRPCLEKLFADIMEEGKRLASETPKRGYGRGNYGQVVSGSPFSIDN